MKRRVAMWLALLMLLGTLSGIAQQAPLQREDTITLEGTQEQFLATQYTRPGQYSLWYADADFEPTETQDGVTFALRNNFLNADVHLDITRAGEPGTDAQAVLQQATQAHQQEGWQVTAAEENSLPLEDAQVMGFVASREAQIARVYTVALRSGLYTLTITYPMEAAEGWGARLFHYAMTLATL